MHPTGVTANLPVIDVDEAAFLLDYLGLSVEEMNLGWVARFSTPDGRASVQVVTRDESAPVDSRAVRACRRRGRGGVRGGAAARHEIVHPLTTEPWGVRRFFVRAPNGTVVNIVSHRTTDDGRQARGWSVLRGLARQREHLVQRHPSPVRDVGVDADRVDDAAVDEGLERPDEVRQVDPVHRRAVADVLLEERDALVEGCCRSRLTRLRFGADDPGRAVGRGGDGLDDPLRRADLVGQVS